VPEAERSIARNADNPDESLQVAVLDDRIVGLVHLSYRPHSPLHEDDSVQVDHLFVDWEHRRRGVGRALMAQAATWAEEMGSTQILAAVSANARDANRFLACLGVMAVATVRSVPVAVLRQRLCLAEQDSADTPALLARRRTMLRRQITLRSPRQPAAHM
jgi:GNAT superfamily N-acetyltransferase